MVRPIKKFTDRECALVNQALAERFGQPMAVQAIEAEIQLNLLAEALTLCPALTWEDNLTHFVIFKTGDSRFRCQFYYTDVEQFGTGQEEYDNLGDCVISLLQVQAEHEAKRQSLRRGMNAVDFDKANNGEEYHAPIII
jgi:hypothetical protein